MSNTHRLHLHTPPRLKDEPPTARRELRLHNALQRAMKSARPLLGCLRMGHPTDVHVTLAEIRNAEAALDSAEPVDG